MAAFITACAVLAAGSLFLAAFAVHAVTLRIRRRRLKAKLAAAEAEMAETGVDATYSIRKEVARGERDIKLSHLLGLCSVTCMVAAVALLVCCSCYHVKPNDIVVLDDIFTDEIVVESVPGLHIKRPWQSATYFRAKGYLRFEGSAQDSVFRGNLYGCELSLSDADGAPVAVDVFVSYGIDRDKAVLLYTDYVDHENMARQALSIDVRDCAARTCGSYSYVELLSGRGDVDSTLRAMLDETWDGLGISTERVSVLSVRYPHSVEAAFAQAKRAEVLGGAQ